MADTTTTANANDPFSWLDSAWNAAQGIFSNWIDYQKWGTEQKLAQSQLDAQTQLALAQAPKASSGISSGTVTVMVVGGVVLVGAYLLLRK